MPTILIVGGPNGAGKTTFANALFEERGETGPFLNADEISREPALASLKPAERNMRAGRLLLERMESLVEAREGFAFETTLSSGLYARRIPGWRKIGYRIALEYVRLPSVEASLERVARRVALGGHDIPEADIRRRFDRSLRNLEQLYKPAVDVWQVWDSQEKMFILAAWDAK
jgi:predicted ABC-type ATPase